MELNYENNKIKKIFANVLLKKGKKTNSEFILKKLLIKIKKVTKKNPNKLLQTFINNTTPKIKYIELQKGKKRKKRKNFYLFIFLYENKQIKIPIKWLLENNKKKIYNYSDIVKDLIQTEKNKGTIINKKKNYYKEIKKLKFFF